MYRVLLVDDDLIVRMFLKAIPEWEKFGFQIIGEACDGEEALRAAAAGQIDLILTDISMPRMNGVELTRRLREGGYDGVIVALSCHDDFDFVKNALQYGADEYLLKNHLSEDSLGPMLEGIRAQVEKRRQESANRRRLQDLAHEGRHSLQRMLLGQLLSGEVSADELPRLLLDAGLSGICRRYAVLLFRPVGTAGKSSLLRQCVQHIRQEDVEFLELSHSIGAAFLGLSDIPSLREQEEQIRGLCGRIEQLSEMALSVPAVIAVSKVCEGEDALLLALRQAYPLLQCGFYRHGIYRYGHSNMSVALPDAAGAFEERLDALLLGESAVLETAYDRALQAFSKANTYPATVQEWLRRCDRIAGVRRKESFYVELQWFSQYQGCIQDYLLRQKLRRQAQELEAVSPAVREGVYYIRYHYAEPIGLASVAAEANLTPTYFSALFKKEMGIGFAEYLLDTRLEHVKRGLRETSLPIKVLSEQAGFQDYQHFCKTFKKKEGISPREYRKNFSMKS